MAERQAAITDLLEKRGRAVLDRNRAAFLALIDPAAGRFRDRQATVFDRLTKVPFATWEYDYSGEASPLTGYAASGLPKGSVVARVILRYTFDGSDSPVESQQFLTVVPRDDTWFLAGDRHNLPGVPSGALGQDIWEVGPVTVVRGRFSLVLGASQPSVLRAYARHADLAVRDVDAVWTSDWSRRPVIIVPRTQADMAAIVGTSEAIAEQLTAVATGYYEPDVSHGDRVVVNPAAWEELDRVDRRLVMTHEVTHLVTQPGDDGSVPVWMGEGFADYVAYRAAGYPAAAVAEDFLEEVLDKDAPRELPRDRDFDPAYGAVETAYEEALLAVDLIVDRYGERKLIELYQAMGDDEEPVEQDVRTVLGIPMVEFVQDWRTHLRTVARDG